jgi:hypothetical protein
VECPHCKLVNPPTAFQCDCGYNFVTQSRAVGRPTVAPAPGWRAPAFFVLPAAYVSLAFAVQAGMLQWEGSWGWFIVMMTGLPISAIGLLASFVVGPFIGFSLFGGFQWYLVNRGIVEVWRGSRPWFRRKR